MQDQNPFNLDDKLSFALALSKTINDKEMSDQQSENYIKKFLKKLLKKFDQEQCLKKSQLKALNNLMVNAIKEASSLNEFTYIMLEIIRNFISSCNNSITILKDNFGLSFDILANSLNFAGRVMKIALNMDKKSAESIVELEKQQDILLKILLCLLNDSESKLEKNTKLIDMISTTKAFENKPNLLVDINEPANANYFNQDEIILNMSLISVGKKSGLSYLFAEQFSKNKRLYDELIFQIIGFIKMLVQVESQAISPNLNSWFRLLFKQEYNSLKMIEEIVNVFNQIPTEKSINMYELIIGLLAENKVNNIHGLLYLIKSFTQKVISNPNSLLDKGSIILNVISANITAIDIKSPDIPSMKFSEILQTLYDIFTIITLCISGQTLPQQQQPRSEILTKEIPKALEISKDLKEFKEFIEDESSYSIKEFSMIGQMKDYSTELDRSVFSNQYIPENPDEIYFIPSKDDEMLINDPSFVKTPKISIKDDKDKMKKLTIGLDDINILKLLNDFISKLFSFKEFTSLISFSDITRLLGVLLQCISSSSVTSTESNTTTNEGLKILKQRLIELINIIFNNRINYSVQFYKDSINYLNHTLIQEEPYPESYEFYYMIIRIMLTLLLSKTELNNIVILLQGLINIIFAKTAKNIHVLAFFIFLKIMNPIDKNSLLNTILDYGYNCLKNTPNMISICMIYEILNMKDNKASNIDLMIMDISTSKEELEFDKILTEDFIIGNIKVNKDMFNDCTIPLWVNQQLKDKLITFQKELNLIQDKILQKSNKTSELIAIIINLNSICKSITPEFTDLSYLDHFDQYKINVQSTNLFNLLTIQKTLMGKLPEYQGLNLEQKHLFMVHNLAFLIKLNMLLHSHTSKIEGQNKESKHMVAEEVTKVLLDYLMQMYKNVELIHANVKNITNQIISWLLNRAGLPVNEEILNFCSSLHIFSRFSSYKPDRFFKKYLKASGMVMGLINFSKFYRENIQKEISKYIDLLKQNDIFGFFLKIAALTMQPTKFLKTDINNTQQIELAKYCDELILFILTLQEILQIVNSLLKIIQIEYKIEVSNDLLISLFSICSENMMINNECDNFVEEEIYNDCKIFEGPKLKPNKKEYTKLFFQMKKYSNVVNMIKISENIIKKGGQNALFVQKELLNVINHLNKNELSVIESKVAIMLLSCIENGLSLTQISEIYMIPEEFLNFTYKCLNLSANGSNIQQKFVKSIIHLIYIFNLKFPNLHKLINKAENNNITKDAFLNKLSEKSLIVFIDFLKNLEPPKSSTSEKLDKPADPMKADKLTSIAIKKPYSSRSTQKKDQLYLLESLREAINKKGKKSTKQIIHAVKKKAPIIEKKNKFIKDKLIQNNDSRDESQILPIYDNSYILFIHFYTEIGRILVNKMAGQLEIERCISQRLLNPGYSLAYLKTIYSKKMEVEGGLKLDEAYFISSRLELSYFLDFLKNLLTKLQGRIISNLSYDQLALRVSEIITNIAKNLLENISNLSKKSTIEIEFDIENNILGMYDIVNIMKSISNANPDIRFNLFDNMLLLIFWFINEIIPIKIENTFKTLIDEFIFQLYTFVTSFISKPDITKDLDYVKLPIEPIKEEPLDENMVCTYVKTGKNHRPQHWYYCYTCNLTDRKGCCTVCAKVCHKGHDVVYSTNSNFFCDCGDGEGTSECISLKKTDNKQDRKQVKQKEKKTLETLHELILSRKLPLEKMTEGFKGLPEEFFRAIEKQAEPLPLKFKNLEDYEVSSSNHEILEEEKSMGTCSEDDSEKDDLQNFEELNIIYQKIRPSNAIIPHRILENRFSKYSPSMKIPSRLAYILNKDGNLKDKGNNSNAIEAQQKTFEMSEEESITLSNIQDYIEERSVVSTNSYAVSPLRSKDVSIIEDRKAFKENMENNDMVMNNEKMKEIFNKFSQSFAKGTQKFNFVQAYVNHLNGLLDEYLNKTRIQDKNKEELSVIPTLPYLLSKSVDFSLLINAKLKQALESKISNVNKILLCNFETKLRPDALGSLDKKVMGLLHLTNPPAKKAMDYNYKNWIVISEGDKLYIFDKKTLLGLDGKLQPADNKSRQAIQPGPFGGGPTFGGSLFGSIPQPKTSLLGQGEDSQGQQFAFDKTKNLTKISMNFAVFGVVFNKHYPNLLVAAGLYSLSVITLDQNTGKPLSTKNIDIMLDSDFVLKAGWLPSKKNHIWVATLKSIRIFDLAQDYSSPVLFFSTLDAYLRDAEVIERPQYKDYRVIIASADGQLYTQLFDVEGKTVDNCEELIMVEAIMTPNEFRSGNKTATAIHYSTMCKMMFASYDDGNSFFGKFVEKECELINVTRLNPYENKDKLSMFPSISKFGNVFTQYEDVYVDDNSYIACSIIRRSGQVGMGGLGTGLNNSGLAMLIKLTKDNLLYQPIFNANNLKADSFTVVDNETQDSRQIYILTLMDDGTLQLNLVNQIDQTGIKQATGIEKSTQISSAPSSDSNTLKLLKEIEGFYSPAKLEDDGVNQELIRTELISVKQPNTVVEFPEKSVSMDQSLLNFEDDLLRLMNGMNKFSRGFQFESLPSGSEKNPLTFTVGLKDKSYIIYGIRMRLTSSVNFKITIFNREINVSSRDIERYVDIPLSEDEMIYGWLANKIKFIIPPLNKKNALKITNIEIYGNKLDTWENEFKTETLTSLKKKLEAIKALEIQEENIGNGESENPMLTTSLDIIKSDKTEQKLIKHLENLCALTSASTFDILDNDEKFLEALLIKLVNVLTSVQELSLKIMAKTTMKNILNVIRIKQGIDQSRIILGHKLDYKTLKDFAMIRNIMNTLSSSQTTTSGIKLDTFGQIIFALNKIQRKRGPQLQKIFTEFPDLINNLIVAGLKLCKENSELIDSPTKLTDFLNNEINYLSELVILHYRYQKNKYLQAQGLVTGQVVAADQSIVTNQSAGTGQSRVNEEIINTPEFNAIGQDDLRNLIEFICMIDKSARENYLKNLVSLIYLETASYQKELETGIPSILEYANDIFIKEADQQQSASKNMILDINQRMTMLMEEEGKDLNEEEMLNLAIKMSLDEEIRQKESSMAIEEKRPKNIMFYKFDISYDLLMVLLQKIQSGVSNGNSGINAAATMAIEDLGIVYKLVYKILKMHQIFCFKSSIPFSDKYINIISNMLYEMIVKNDLKALVNLNDQSSKKLCAMLNMINICLRSKENSHKPYKEESQGQNKPLAPNKFSKIPTKQDKEKKNAVIESVSPTKSINLGYDFAKKLTHKLELLDNDNTSQLSTWLYQALEILFNHFKSSNGTIIANPQTGELTYKKNVNAAKVAKSDIGIIANLWSPIYRKSEIIKHEGLVFADLDQDLFSGLLIFMSNILSYGFTLKNNNNNSKWAELFANIILTSPTSNIAQNFSKMLLNSVAGGKKNYYMIKDKVLFTLEVDKIISLFNQTQEFKKLLTYDQYVTITQALNNIESATNLRPENWASFCQVEPKILNILHLIILFNVEECCERSLKLLAIYYNPHVNEICSRQGATATAGVVSSSSSTNINHDEYVLSYDENKKSRQNSHWLDITQKYVDKYIDELLIESYSKKISSAVVELLIGLWNIGNRDQKLYILNKVLTKLEDIIGYGINSENVFNLIGYMGKNIVWESNELLLQIRQHLSDKLIRIYNDIHSNIVNHSNHNIYLILQNILRDQRSLFVMRYYFDTTACFRCYEGLNIPYHEYRLNDIKTELKYTHNCILAKLNNSLSINSVRINIDDRHSYKQFKVLRTINIFINNKSVNDLVELKNNWNAWKKVMTYNLDKKRNKDEKTYLDIKFPLPITAKNLMVEFQAADTFKSGYDSSVTICPNCLRKFDNRFGGGKCFNCSESVLECRKCGYFAEDKYDNLICSQCGASKYMTYDIMVSARVGFSNEIIDSDKAKEICEKNIASTLQKMNLITKEISETRSKIQDLISIYQGRDDTITQNKEEITLTNKIFQHGIGQTLIHDIVNAYATTAREEYEKLMKMIGSIKSSRKAIHEYVSSTNYPGSSSNLNQSILVASDFNTQERLKSNKNCYGCLQNALMAYFNFYSNTDNIRPYINTLFTVENDLMMSFLRHSVYDYSDDIFKFVKNAIVSINFADFKNKNIRHCQQTIDMFVENVIKVIKGNSFNKTNTNVIQGNELKIIYRQVIILIEICNTYQNELVYLNSKHTQEIDNDLLKSIRDFWSKILDKIYNIFYLILDIDTDMDLLVELILCEILKYIKNLIKFAKTEESSKKVKSEEEEDKEQNEEDEEIKASELIEEESDNDSDKIEMIIEEDIKDLPTGATTSKKVTEIYKDALSRLISKLMIKSQTNIEKSSLEMNSIINALEAKKEYKLDENNWLTKCLIHPVDKVSQMAGEILKELITDESFYLIYEVILASYTKAHTKTRRSENFFNILKEFSLNYLDFEKNNHVVKLTIKLINSIFIQVESDLRKLYEEYQPHLEGYTSLYMLDLKSGYEIRETLDMICNLIQNKQKLRNELKVEKNSLQYILNCFLIVRKFNVIKNHHMAEIEIKLNNMLDYLKPDSENDKKAFISECVTTLFIYDGYKDIVSQAFLIEQILNIISPVKQRPDFMIDFKKVHTQEEFIKGVISKNPYRASDIGYTMNDVRNKICKELEISDPNPFELLVANNIVELDLPIHLVYEKIWVPYIKQREEEGHIAPVTVIPSMQVVFRIAGLDGEATENRISNLVDEMEDDKDQEKRFRLTEALLSTFTVTLPNKQTLETSGVELILRKLKEVGVSTAQKSFLKSIIKLLSLCSKLQPARKMIFKLKGVKILLELLLHYIPTYEENEKDSIVENILIILESVLKESEDETDKIGEKMELEGDLDPQHGIENINLCMKRISKTGDKNDKSINNKILSALTKILPFLTNNLEQASQVLLDYFKPHLYFNANQNDTRNNDERTYYINRFIEMLEILPSYYNTFRRLLRSEGIVIKVVSFIKSLLPDSKNLLNEIKSMENNQKNLSFCLKILVGLINGDIETQIYLKNEGVLDTIYKLSDPKIKVKDIGKYAEAIIDHFLNPKHILDESVANYINGLKEAERQEKKRLAEKKRLETLKFMGIGKMVNPVVLQAQAREEAKKMEIEEEKTLSCISCHEGYTFKPNDILGVYVYTKKHKIPDEESWVTQGITSQETQGIATVTHFNCIHLSCHNAAAKAEKNMKKPKQEWEGAIIRNSHTKCNGWFPIRGPKTTQNEYETGVNKFYSTVDSIKYNQDRIWVFLNDLKILLTKFAKHETFAKETKGGAEEHNLKLIPFYIQLIIYLLKQKGDKLNQYHFILENFLKQNTKEKYMNTYANIEDFYLTLTIALVLVDTQTWNDQMKPALLYYIMSCGSNLIKDVNKQTLTTHNIKNKLVLSPFLNIPRPIDKISDFSLDQKGSSLGEDSNKAINIVNQNKEIKIHAEHEEKIDKLLDKILPLMIILKMSDEIINKLHVKVSVQPLITKGLNKGFILDLDQYLCSKYDEVIVTCENITKAYKDEILNLKSFEDFINCCNLKDIVLNEFKGLDQFVTMYLG